MQLKAARSHYKTAVLLALLASAAAEVGKIHEKGRFFKKATADCVWGWKRGTLLPATRDSPFSVSPSKANLCEIAAKECEQG